MVLRLTISTGTTPTNVLGRVLAGPSCSHPGTHLGCKTSGGGGRQSFTSVLHSQRPRYSTVRIRSQSKSEEELSIKDAIRQRNQDNPVVVYSKTWCSYSGNVKSLFRRLGVAFLSVELDQRGDGAEIQAALRSLTGQSTVPNVFIGGKHIGGCDATVALHQQGKLADLLEAAGVKLH